MVQKLEESFDVAGGKNPKTPAVAGQVLVRGDRSNMLGTKETTQFRSGTEICMFMMQWLRPEILMQLADVQDKCQHRGQST